MHETLLQSTVEELVAWFFRWALEMDRQNNDPDRQEQQRLGGKAYGVSPLTTQDRERKRSLQSIIDEQKLGAKLAKKKDAGEVSWNELATWEQDLVEQHEQGSSKKNTERQELHRKKRHKLFEA